MVLTPDRVQSKIQARLSVLISPDPATLVTLARTVCNQPASLPLLHHHSILRCFQLSKITPSPFPFVRNFLSVFSIAVCRPCLPPCARALDIPPQMTPRQNGDHGSRIAFSLTDDRPRAPITSNSCVEQELPYPTTCPCLSQYRSGHTHPASTREIRHPRDGFVRDMSNDYPMS
jgi:hypothetical protein